MDESKNRIPSTAGYVNPSMLPKGPNGRALCRACQQETPRGRRTFCSDMCVKTWQLNHQPALQREASFKRDKGVCRNCGIDTEQLRARWRHIKGHWTQHCPKMPRPYPHFSSKEDLDTDQLSKRVEEHRAATSRWEAERSRLIMEHKALWEKDAAEAKQLGFTTKHLYEMDHILEVVNGGGGGFNPDNCQTLCIPCHHAKTAQLARTRAEQRKANKELKD